MARKATNTCLHKAKEAKSDEFYTQYCDIERELHYYIPQFYGKTVYCNCDKPGMSNFIKYFIDNFQRFKLKKLLASYYIKDNRTLFPNLPYEPGGYIEYTGSPTDIEIKAFSGNGDFRQEESIRLLKESDIVVTNPPFSLFREFISQLIKYDKRFLVIGNINALTYKEIFNLIKENKMWLGYNFGRGISGFIVPDYYELYGTETKIDETGNRIVSTNNCLWLTNLCSPLRNKFIPLSKTYNGSEENYPKFDNFNGINVNRTADIPLDYEGIMGVPITFLHKYNPLQFEIVQFRKGDDGKDLSVNGSCPYFRVLIRNISNTHTID